MSDRLIKKYGEPTFVEETTSRDDIVDYEAWFRAAIRRAKQRGAMKTEAIMSLDGKTLQLYEWDHSGQK